MNEQKFEEELARLRSQIDRLDEQLVSVVNERATLVREIVRLKQSKGMPLHSPQRETEVLQRILANNRGPVENEVLEAIFRLLLRGSD